MAAKRKKAAKKKVVKKKVVKKKAPAKRKKAAPKIKVKRRRKVDKKVLELLKADEIIDLGNLDADQKNAD